MRGNRKERPEKAKDGEYFLLFKANMHFKFEKQTCPGLENFNLIHSNMETKFIHPGELFEVTLDRLLTLLRGFQAQGKHVLMFFGGIRLVTISFC